MRYLNTIMGPIHPEQMSLTAVHEHVVWPPPAAEDPAWLAALPKSIERHYNELVDFRLSGGRTIVDVSGPGLGRDLDVLVLLAKNTMLNIVASTGIGLDDPAPTADADALEERFTQELTRGIGQTSVTAGIISIALNNRWAAPNLKSVCQAAGRAARQTGAAVTVFGGDRARESADALIREGLPGERIIAGHLDEKPDLARDVELARRGVYVCYDHVGVEEWSSTSYGWPDSRRVEMVKAMLEAGQGDRLLLSCDSNCTELGNDRPPLHNLGYLLRCFVPRLLEAGVSQEDVHRVLVDNPKRVIPIQ